MYKNCIKENVYVTYPNIFMYKQVAIIDTMVQNYHSSINSNDYSYMKNSMSFFRYLYFVITKKVVVAIEEENQGKKKVLGYSLFDIKKGARGKILVINSIGVKKEERNLGIGSMIFDRVKSIAESKKLSKIELLVDSKNNGAICFYNSLGLNETKRKMQIYI